MKSYVLVFFGEDQTDCSTASESCLLTAQATIRALWRAVDGFRHFSCPEITSSSELRQETRPA